MNISISGYTAAGKTTHARLISEALDMEYVSAAEMLLDRLGYDRSQTVDSAIWFKEYAQIGRRLDDTTIDSDLDRALVERARSDDRVIFDARFLPWAGQAPLIRIWLESDLPSRARKCYVSMDGRTAGVPQCAAHVHHKDMLDVERLLKGHEGIYGPNPEIFDAMLDNSDLIPDATRSCADKGIAIFQDYMLATVEHFMGDDGRLHSLHRRNPRQFRRCVRLVRDFDF
jgi:cytidylate kinase